MNSEDSNPYAPPNAPLGEPGILRRSFWWKAYFWLVVALFLMYLAMGFAWMQPLDLLDLGITLVGAVGLFGYAYSRCIGGPALWKAWFPVQLLWDLSYSFLLVPSGVAGQIPLPEGETISAVDSALGLLVASPLYAALYLYGYRSSTLWRRTGAA